MTTFVENICWDRPQAPALADAEQQITYGQLRELTQAVAQQIASEFGRGNYIALKATPDVTFVVRLLATMQSGNTPIPVDPESPEETLQFIVEKSRAVGVLDNGFASGAANGRPPAAAPIGPDPEMPAVVMFTSGTSGYPKGAVISHANLLHACRAVANYLDYHTHRSAAVVLPLHYSYALLSQVCCQLTVGGFVYLFDSLRNPVKVAQQAAAHGLSTFCGVPSTFHALGMVHRMAPLSFPSVRVVCSAGAAMEHALYTTIKEIFPNSTLFNNYGMTEAAPRISYIAETDPRFMEPTCGRPIDGVQVKIVDPETHRELLQGEQGVLVVRGPNITAGYLNDEALTRSAFTSDGFLISGDVGYFDGEYIMICGRQDDIFGVGGEKVAPLEIERVLNRIPCVIRAAVCGLPDAARGKIPAAFVQLSQPATRRDLQSQLKPHLSPNKIPQRFFEVESFPTTPNGKLMRRQLSPTDARVVREIR